MNIQLSDKIYKLFKKLFKFYWKGFLYLRLCFGFFEPVLGIFSQLSWQIYATIAVSKAIF